ncbi:MAG: hypothetical protein JSR99_15355 [Proteobacteria bacterium]|nr:hypothetical protein [Pseudomonadota bacterium]
MRLRSVLAVLLQWLSLFLITVFSPLTQMSVALEPRASIPAWLRAHVGDGEGQISKVVLERARALYLQKLRDGKIKNPCYFGMDATRPHDLGGGKLGRRFYIVCEARRSYRAIPAGHGGGRNLKGIVDFSNGRRCAANFGNALDSKLTAGGAYLTAEAKTSFKGYYRASNKMEILKRTFIRFDGQEDTANARAREIGGHAAIALKNVCLRKQPGSPYENPNGYVPFGELVDYSGGRSDGCTSWSPADARQIVRMTEGDPTTLYIYPEAADVSGVAQALAAHQQPPRQNLYWNASCLKEIRSPKFWSKETLGPIIAQYEKDHPPPPERPPPMCKIP